MATLRFFLALTLIFLPVICSALTCGTLVYNPIVGHLDCIGFTIPAGATVGECLQITGTNPFTIGFAVCGSTVAPTVNSLLLGNGSFFLLSDSGKLTLTP